VGESIIASSEKSERNLHVISKSRRSSPGCHRVIIRSKVEVNGISWQGAFLMICVTNEKIAAEIQGPD
jgi:hypothetical protein